MHVSISHSMTNLYLFLVSFFIVPVTINTHTYMHFEKVLPKVLKSYGSVEMPQNKGQ